MDFLYCINNCAETICKAILQNFQRGILMNETHQ